MRNTRIITDGTRALHVVNVASNPHTRENQFAWLPRERMILQGDLFYYQEGGAFRPSGRETMNRFFSTWLRKNHFAPAAVYGVHYSGAAGVEALDRSASRNR